MPNTQSAERFFHGISENGLPDYKLYPPDKKMPIVETEVDPLTHIAIAVLSKTGLFSQTTISDIHN